MTTVKVGCRTPWYHGEGGFPAAHAMASEKRCGYSVGGSIWCESGAKVGHVWSAAGGDGG